MTILYFSQSSPYSAKVRMAVAYAGLPVTERSVDTSNDPAELLAANPLGKIPALVTDDGEAIYDSRVIIQHLNRISGMLLPRNAQRRLVVERNEALADGICDCLLSIVYEGRYRPPEMVYQPWLDRQWSKAERALDQLAANLPRASRKADAGQFAIRAMLSYLDLRFEGKYRRGRAKLARWTDRFDGNFPALAPLLPNAKPK